MADLNQPPEDIFVEKFKEICLSNSSIFGKIGKEKINGQNVRQIYYNQSTPVGKVYPEVNYDYMANGSEEVLPSESGVLRVSVYDVKDKIESNKTLSLLLGAIHDKINKNPQIFSEVDTANRRGLHCVRCVRTSKSPCEFDSYDEVYGITALYDIRISDKFDDFGTANNQDWNPNI